MVQAHGWQVIPAGPTESGRSPLEMARRPSTSGASRGGAGRNSLASLDGAVSHMVPTGGFPWTTLYHGLSTVPL